MHFANSLLWAIFIFGIFASIAHLYLFKDKADERKTKLAKLHQKAFEAQRKGDMKLAGKFLLEAESLEAEITNERGDK